MFETTGWLMVGVFVTVLVVLHLRTDWAITGKEQLAAWTALGGGATYGLGLFDGSLLPHFNFYYMGVVQLGSFVVLNFLLFTKRGNKLVAYRHRTPKRAQRN